MDNKDITHSLEIIALSREVLPNSKSTHEFNKEFDEQESLKEFLNTTSLKKDNE